MLNVQEIQENRAREQAQMWELFAEIMDIDPDFCFTARELAQTLKQPRQQVSYLLFCLSQQNAVKTQGKALNGATLYSVNPDFLTTG